MTPFLRSYLREPPGPIQIAVFGKHPAWDDFMDDLGLDTPRLIEARRMLLGAREEGSHQTLFAFASAEATADR